MNTLTPGQIPTGCESARIRMPSGELYVCHGGPVTHVLTARLLRIDPTPNPTLIRQYICGVHANEFRTDPRKSKYCIIEPLDSYEF